MLEQKAAAALSKQLDEALTAKSNLTQELDSLRARCEGLDSELENAQRQDMQNRSRFDGQVSAPCLGVIMYRSRHTTPQLTALYQA